MRGIHRLSATRVESLKRPGMHADGGGLYLQVSKAGTKSWIFRYQLDRRPREMGLGAFHPEWGVSLAEARDRAAAARKLKNDGKDPIELRREEKAAKRAESARQITFRAAAERFIDSHKAAWKNAKHADQWGSTLETYAYPILGEIAVCDVDTGVVLKVLEAPLPVREPRTACVPGKQPPVVRRPNLRALSATSAGVAPAERFWTGRPETASRVRGRIEAILDWARVRGYRMGENPARWRGHLDKLLPASGRVRAVKHHAALPFAELPAFMPLLKTRDAIAARALEFAILTAARTGEVIGATWSEIDLREKVWTVPARRMKGKREHRVPLSDRAVLLLAELPAGDPDGYVFLGGRQGEPLSNMALLQMLKRMGRGDLTAHGFRSTFRDWAAERTGYAGELVEMALAHAISNKVEAAYRRGDLFEKRRKLMTAWAQFCSRPAALPDNVTLLKRAGGARV